MNGEVRKLKQERHLWYNLVLSPIYNAGNCGSCRVAFVLELIGSLRALSRDGGASYSTFSVTVRVHETSNRICSQRRWRIAMRSVIDM